MRDTYPLWRSIHRVAPNRRSMNELVTPIRQFQYIDGVLIREPLTEVRRPPGRAARQALPTSSLNTKHHEFGHRLATPRPPTVSRYSIRHRRHFGRNEVRLQEIDP